MPTTKYSKAFPWPRIEKGQGFFVPCVNTAEVIRAGMNEALRHRVLDAKAYPAVHKGLSGVWFFRRPPAP